MKTKLLIIADDLTGGLDTGVQLAGRGISTRVMIDPGAQIEWDRMEVQVLVAVSETRHLSPEKAYETVFDIASGGKKAGIPYVYKKTDSALRGNVGAELGAVFHAYGADLLPFLPAYPAMKRFTIGGRQYIGGVPAEESVFGRDPFDPVRESDIRKLIRMQSDVPVIPETGQGRGILAVDAQSDEDLMAAGRKLADAGALSVSAGCAGFAACLPELIGLCRDAPRGACDLGDSLLVVSGSLNPITLKQLCYAENHGFMRVRPDLFTRPAPEREPAAAGEWRILDGKPADCLAEALYQAKQAYRGTVMVIGGDTLHACMARLGCYMLEPLKELFPGVVLSKYRTGDREQLLISKSGGFGDESLLADLRSLMEAQHGKTEVNE